MKKTSKSPDRHTFQRDGYVKRQTEKGESINKEYLDLFEKIIENDAHKFDKPEDRVNNLEYDLLTTQWILDKVRQSESYAQNLYAAMCNTDFLRLEVMPILKEEYWSCSWRYAGGIVADMRQQGDYIDWYCSGIGSGLGNGDVDGTRGYVSESVVTDEVREDLLKLGWKVIDDDQVV